jgi:hypothetical protein
MRPMSNIVHDLTPQSTAQLVECRAHEPSTDREENCVDTDRIKHHYLMLYVSVAALCLALLLEVSPNGVQVVFRGFTDYPLPETCGAKILFDCECPGCGLTRSFVWAGRGEWARSIRANRVGLIVLLACAAQIPYRWARIRAWRRGEHDERKWPARFGTLLIAVIIGNWVLKVIAI